MWLCNDMGRVRLFLCDWCEELSVQICCCDVQEAGSARKKYIKMTTRVDV